MFYLRDIPKFETLLSKTKRYPQVDPAACEAFLVLLRVASDVLDACEGYLLTKGLSQGRFTVLMILNRDPEVGLSPSDLADRAGVTRATMTGLLDGLEREGLVKREPHAQDRRMLTVRLTDLGRARLDAMLPDYYRRVAALMGGLSEAERKALVSMLRRVEEKLPGMSEGAGAAGTDGAA